MVVYGTGLAGLVLGFALFVGHRVPVDLDVLRDRNALYRELTDGRVENVYTVRIINKDQRAHDFRVTSSGLPNAVVDADHELQHVLAEEVKTVVVRVRVPADQEHGGHDFRIAVEAVDAATVKASSKARFFAAS
jgi:polyferredoxin